MMELFVAFVSSYFTKKPNIGAMGVLNALLELKPTLKFVQVIKLSIEVL